MDLADLKNQQLDLLTRIIDHDDEDSELVANTFCQIAGVDISWENRTNGINDNRGVATIVIMTWPELKLIHSESRAFVTEFPYISGYLGFREVPEYVAVWDEVISKGYRPDLILVDGFGILHPMGCGSASMLGVILNIPTIGIGKTLLVGGCDETDKGMKERLMAENKLGMDIQHGAQIVGHAWRASAEHKNPIYISIGHRISLETAIKITHHCCQYPKLTRQPEPIRYADQLSRAAVKEAYATNCKPSTRV